MITSNDFRPGVTIEIDGQVWAQLIFCIFSRDRVS